MIATLDNRADDRVTDKSVTDGRDRVGGRPVAEIMSSPVLAVPSNTPLDSVLETMLRTGRRHVAVLDPRRRLIGIVSDRDLAAAWCDDPPDVPEDLAGQIVNGAPSVVDTGATVRDVAAVMTRDRVDAVAVVDPQGRALGVVTGADLVHLMAGACLPGPTAAKPARRSFGRVTEASEGTRR